VVLAEAEHIQADLVGQYDGFDQIAQALGRIDQRSSGRVGGALGKGVDADFKGLGHAAIIPSDSAGAATAQVSIRGLILGLRRAPARVDSLHAHPHLVRHAPECLGPLPRHG
jgi:hypothetical protein